MSNSSREELLDKELSSSKVFKLACSRYPNDDDPIWKMLLKKYFRFEVIDSWYKEKIAENPFLLFKTLVKADMVVLEGYNKISYMGFPFTVKIKFFPDTSGVIRIKPDTTGGKQATRKLPDINGYVTMDPFTKEQKYMNIFTALFHDDRWKWWHLYELFSMESVRLRGK